MSNDSTAPGYLSPLTANPPDDLDLDAIIQPAIVGITGMADALVLIKGQGVPPAQPGRPLTWCAFAVTATRADTNASIVHDGSDGGGLGTSTILRSEEHEVTCSFYGPASRAMATLLRDGFAIQQNRAALKASGLVYTAMDRITFVPDLQNTEFVRRADCVFRLRRMAARTYAIRNVVDLQGTITSDASGVETTSPFPTGL